MVAELDIKTKKSVSGRAASGILPRQVGEPSPWQSGHTTLLAQLLPCQAPHGASQLSDYGDSDRGPALPLDAGKTCNLLLTW